MVDVYFDDIIKVDRLDPDGKKFDKGMVLDLLLSYRFCFLFVDCFNDACSLYYK